MPVHKYRSLAAMNQAATWAPRLDPDNLRQAFALTALAYCLRPWRVPPGVREFPSIAAANRAREEWERNTGRFVTP